MKSNSKIKKELSVKKKIIYSLLTIIIAVIMFSFTAEIIVRIFSPQQEAERWFKSDSRYGYVHKKNFYQEYHYPGHEFVMVVKTNSFGHRDREYDLSKRDRKKILLLGDSFVFGYGVNMEDHFDTKLEQLLNKSGENCIVINAGVGGWGTLQEITYAKDYFNVINPDIIIITFCGNDPYDDLRYKYKMRDNEKGLFYFPGKIFLRNHSHLYRFVWKKYSTLLHHLVLKRKIAEGRKTDDTIVLDKQSANIITEEEWNKTLRYMKNFHKDFLKFNSNGVLLVQTTAPWDVNIRKHLASISNGENLIYVDLYNDTILLRPEQRKLPYDRHWTQIMHSIVAENLYKTILGQNGNSRLSPTN